MPKIFAFINSGKGTDWVVGTALSEDGEFLCGHVSSSDAWARADMSPQVKGQFYTERYPDGYEWVWVEDPRNNPEVAAAYAKHVAAGERGTAWNQARARAAKDA